MADDQQQPRERVQLAEPNRQKISGVFSTQTVAKVGAGTTVRKTIQKMYWFVEEQPGGTFEVQPLNTNYVPSGPKKSIPRDEMLQKFSPEPEFYTHTVFPKMKELNSTIERGDRHRRKGELFSAEMQYNEALKVDEENVRANFGLGLTYMERGETSKANNIFERVVKLDAAFDAEHKHLFNEFGINLRKNKMFDQAVDYYERAVSLAATDEHLYYNMARAYFEKHEIEKTRDHLLKALAENPNLDPARQFLEWLLEKGYVTGVSVPPRTDGTGQGDDLDDLGTMGDMDDDDPLGHVAAPTAPPKAAAPPAQDASAPEPEPEPEPADAGDDMDDIDLADEDFDDLADLAPLGGADDEDDLDDISLADDDFGDLDDFDAEPISDLNDD